LLGDFDEEFLQQIPRVRFIAGEVKQEREKSLRMLIIEPCEIIACRHGLNMTRCITQFV